MAITGSITESAAAIRADRSIHYDWMKNDPEYPARFAEAKAQGEEALEDEATLRARVGVYEPNVYQGRFVYPQEQYEITPAVPAGDWKDEGGAKGGTPAVMGWRDVPGSMPLGVWRKSDGLLMFRLRGAFAKYRANAVEVSGAGGGAVQSTLTIEFVKPKE